MEWPIVLENDSGIRPITGPGICCYCQQAVGQPHRRDCVIVTKRVKLRYVFEIDVDVPHSWSKEDIEFHRNDSTWCMDNALAEIEKFNGNDCTCNFGHTEFLRVVDDTPHRETADEAGK